MECFVRPHHAQNGTKIRRYEDTKTHARFASGNSHTDARYTAPPQSADGALTFTQRTRAAAGFCLPPPTLATGTVSPSQRASEQSVPGARRSNWAGAHSSIFCTEHRPNKPRLSSCMRQTWPIVQGIGLRRQNQPVNAWKPKARSAQSAQQASVGARAGSLGAIDRPGRCRQTSARRNQTSAIICRPQERQRAPPPPCL